MLHNKHYTPADGCHCCLQLCCWRSTQLSTCCKMSHSMQLLILNSTPSVQLNKESTNYCCMHMAGPGSGGQPASGPPGFTAPQPVRTSSTGTPGSAFRPPSPSAGMLHVCHLLQPEVMLACCMMTPGWRLASNAICHMHQDGSIPAQHSAVCSKQGMLR